MIKIGLFICGGAVALLSLLSCGDGEVAALPAGEAAIPLAGAGEQDPAAKPLPRARIDYETVKRLFGKDPAAEEIDNAGTPEKLALGKALYHETGLSKDGAVSCASCHDLAKHGVDGRAVPAGTGGAVGKRNAPSTYNAFRQFRQSWDGRAATIEELVIPHALDAAVFGLADEAELLAKVKARPELVVAFGKAFPGDADAVSAANFRLALGAFARTLATKSRWDEYLDGNQRALTNDELFGLKTFMDVGCMTCHVGRLVGGHMYQKTGVLKPYASKDEGRKEVTGSDADRFFFKVPSLLNVEKTAPYMHDGKVATLEEIVKLMAEIQLDRKLTDEQVRGLVAFLKALTGPVPDEFAPKK